MGSGLCLCYRRPAIQGASSVMTDRPIVVAGAGAFTAARVGREAYAAQLAEEASKFTLVKSELRSGINSILRFITYLLIPTALGLIIAFHTIFSVGLAMLMTGLLSAALSEVPLKLYSHGSAIFNTGQQLGGAIGTTIFVTVMSAIAAGEIEAGSALVDGLFDGAHVAFLIGGILASLGVVFALFIKAAPKRP